MPIIYPNYLLMAISFELIWFSLYVTESIEGFNLANNIYTQNSFPCKRMQHFSIESERKKDFILNALDEASLRLLVCLMCKAICSCLRLYLLDICCIIIIPFNKFHNVSNYVFVSQNRISR